MPVIQAKLDHSPLRDPAGIDLHGQNYRLVIGDLRNRRRQGIGGYAHFYPDDTMTHLGSSAARALGYDSMNPGDFVVIALRDAGDPNNHRQHDVEIPYENIVVSPDLPPRYVKICAEVLKDFFDFDETIIYASAPQTLDLVAHDPDLCYLPQ